MKPVPQRRGDDCLRASLASILELTAEETGITDGRGRDWFRDLVDVLARYGLYPIETSPSVMRQWFAEDAWWLCMVPSLHDRGHHTVVMRGAELVHDPGQRRPNYDTAKVWQAVNDGAACTAVLIAVKNPAEISLTCRAAA